MSNKLIISVIFSSIMGALIALLGYKLFIHDDASNNALNSFNHDVLLSGLSNKKNLDSNNALPLGNTPNFITASEKTIPSVVHIRSYYNRATSSRSNESFDDLFREFFGEKNQPNQDDGYYKSASGSGVIISSDGFIATNNHVIENAEKLEVVLYDKRTYTAELIGSDPTTDLALLKIEEKELSYIPYGNSDQVKVGQWVLAVGNPFDLTSTVTAGIVSAKARNINILRSKGGYAIESFIQTDAAVNPGNSGGALVDLNGLLIGVNTAIATQTGSFSGYSFAIPSTLVQKVLDDLKNYGEVQRAIMGIQIIDLNASLAESEEIDKIEGVYVASASENGGAKEAGIEKGDVILSIDGTEVNNVASLQELVARKRPGDTVIVTFKRKGKNHTVRVLLKNTNFTTEVVKPEKVNKVFIESLGADFIEITQDEKDELGIDFGIKVTDLKRGKLSKAGIKSNFIITHVDKEEVKSPQELQNLLKSKEGGLLIKGIYPDGEIAFYGIGF